MLPNANRFRDLRRSTLRWCRRTRISASTAARDRYSPIKAALDQPAKIAHRERVLADSGQPGAHDPSLDAPETASARLSKGFTLAAEDIRQLQSLSHGTRSAGRYDFQAEPIERARRGAAPTAIGRSDARGCRPRCQRLAGRSANRGGGA